MGLETIYDMLTSTEKLGLVIDRVLENQEGENPIDTSYFHMELDQITHNVPNKETSILEDISMKINAKSRILIKGESGSGKSSLLKIIAGIEQTEYGYIYVNGLSLKSLDINQYRADLGVSLAEESLFEGTLINNLTFV